MIQTVPVKNLDTAMVFFWYIWDGMHCGEEGLDVQVSCSMPGFLANPIYWYRHVLRVPGKPWGQSYSGPWSCLLPARNNMHFVSHCPNVSRQSSHRVRAGSACTADSTEYEQLMEKVHLAKQWSTAVWTVRDLQLWNREKKITLPFLKLGGDPSSLRLNSTVLILQE